MRKIYYICVLCFFMLLIIACNAQKGSSDPFYSSTGEWDTIRFPLIKPYEATYLKLSDNWNVALHVSPTRKKIYWYLNINSVQKIAVANGVILIYSTYEPYVSEDAGQKVLNWFVIIPEEKLETGFDNEDDFMKFIRSFGIEAVAWESPGVLHQQFLDSGCLDWIPDCQ